MILVVVGTEQWPFDRLVKEVDRLAGAGAFDGEPVFMQLGSCLYRPTHCEWAERIGFDDMLKKVDEARLVVAHAGAGTFLLCRRMGTPEIMMPRRVDRGEHLDDHQVLFAERLAAQGLVQTVAEADMLREAMATSVATPVDNDAKPTSPLVSQLRSLTREWGLS